MTPLPFPSTGGGGGGTEEYDSKMRIDIPREADGTAAAAAPPKKGGGLQPAHAPLSTVNNKEDAAASAHARGGSAPNTWLHHPRQPLASSDSYFPSTPGGSQQHPHQSAQRTPGGSLRGHSRQGSIVAGSAPQQQQQPNHATLSRKQAANMSLSLSAGGLPSSSDQATGQPAANGSVANLHDSAVGDYPVDGGFGGGGPPSPSTLTDIILGLHSTLYGGKRLPEEVREMVQRYYDYDAVFESPLLSARGREEIANQFIMAFALPGMDVYSELRDVICSDFEFDGTRAGIIDQTISVTFLPSIFGPSAMKAQSGPYGSAGAAGYGGDGTGNAGYGEKRAGGGFGRAGSATPAYTLQSGVSPHPFANYGASAMPSSSHIGQGGSTFSRFGGGTQPHSPTTPYSLSSMWGGSRPHTPGWSSSAMRPLSAATTTQQARRISTPPSVNGDDEAGMDSGTSTVMATADGALQSNFVHAGDSTEAGQGQLARPAMPSDALVPHWTHTGGLGRESVRAIIWGLFHPRAVLKNLCTIHLRLMSRLEFNDAGMIVRHEDTWGLRETIEGTIPFASMIYALERRVVGYLCSYAIGKGFRLSSALSRTVAPNHGAYGVSDDEYHTNANHAARALLLGGGGADGIADHGDSQFSRHDGFSEKGSHSRGFTSSSASFFQQPHLHRSRATSPSRHHHYGGSSRHHQQRFGPQTPYSAGGPYATTGTRSRARSLVGANLKASASSDNLHLSSSNLAHLNNMTTPGGTQMTGAASTSGLGGYGERERGASHTGAMVDPMAAAGAGGGVFSTLPPDSGARYKKKGEAGRTNSAPASHYGDVQLPDEISGPGSGEVGPSPVSATSAAALERRTRAPDQDL